MFEPVDDKTWWGSWWSPRGSSKEPPPEYRRTVPLEGNPSVEAISDSTVRFVADPSGMSHQLLSSEPLGHPRLALHQNHYAAPTGPGTSLGSIDFYARDQQGATMSAYVDDQWTPNSHPTGLSFRVTQPGSLTPRYPAMTIRADGRLAVGGGPTAFGNPLVSMGVYRQGIFELPSVGRYQDLTAGSSSEHFVNGAIVYAKDIDRVLISQGGSWHAIVTEPVKQVTWRQIGQPRKDGLPTSFGPRNSIRQ